MHEYALTHVYTVTCKHVYTYAYPHTEGDNGDIPTNLPSTSLKCSFSGEGFPEKSTSAREHTFEFTNAGISAGVLRVLSRFHENHVI